MTYYYYDKVLVSNCRLKSLSSFAGKMARDSVIQLSVHLAGTEEAPDAPGGISLAGDFYQVAIPGKVTYRIHKKGSLIRAYVTDFLCLEETVMGIPASVAALLKGKALLRGSLLHAGEWAYAVIGGTDSTEKSGCTRAYTRGAAPGTAVMALERGERIEGVAHFASFYAEEATETRGLLGILALQGNRAKGPIEPISEPGLKKAVILENIVGYELFPPELRQRANDSGIIDRISRELYMASMLAL